MKLHETTRLTKFLTCLKVLHTLVSRGGSRIGIDAYKVSMPTINGVPVLNPEPFSQVVRKDDWVIPSDERENMV